MDNQIDQPTLHAQKLLQEVKNLRRVGVPLEPRAGSLSTGRIIPPIPPLLRASSKNPWNQSRRCLDHGCVKAI